MLLVVMSREFESRREEILHSSAKMKNGSALAENA